MGSKISLQVAVCVAYLSRVQAFCGSAYAKKFLPEKSDLVDYAARISSKVLLLACPDLVYGTQEGIIVPGSLTFHVSSISQVLSLS